ncbi:hypothetical protein N9917_02350 [Deltaproteobacteria bacterium]|nr:hypothetical protein [Deltaproteobacteria bacterium]
MPDPVTAMVGGGAVSAIAGVSSANTAADAQTQAAQIGADAQAAATKLGIEEQQRQFDLMQEVLGPYADAGTAALPGFSPFQDVGAQAFQSQQNLMGLGDPGTQAAAIEQIAQSPQMTAMVQQGENAMLQNASATGGLRGGNLQHALAQFRPQMLNQLIEQQYSKLGGLAGTGLDATRNLATLGQASAAGVGSAGIQTGQGIANLYGQQGQAQAQAANIAGAAQAGGALGQGQAISNVASSIPQAMMMNQFMGGGGWGGGGNLDAQVQGMITSNSDIF